MAARNAAAPVATADDVARYFLALATEDGDLITNLKMQKLVYYAYAWTLVANDQKLFAEPIEAWPNGPVVPTLYQALKRYGSRPLDERFLRIGSDEEFAALASKFPDDVLETLNGVYEEYMRMSAFDLVTRTHSERPWREARRGLGPSDYCETAIRDEDIIAEYRAA